MKNVTTRETVPCAYVTKGKQRMKQFDKSVYLNDGDEFEIELFNPTTNKVLAEIELNGVSIGAGIVLRPGERVFLERYIETARKFLFETYNVSGSNADVKAAIALNGNVSVKFYAESIPVVYRSTTYPPIDWSYWGNYHTGTGKGLYNQPIATYDSCGFGDVPVAASFMANVNTTNGGGTMSSNVNYNDVPKQEIKMASVPSPKNYKSPGIYFMELDQSIEPQSKSVELQK